MWPPPLPPRLCRCCGRLQPPRHLQGAIAPCLYVRSTVRQQGSRVLQLRGPQQLLQAACTPGERDRVHSSVLSSGHKPNRPTHSALLPVCAAWWLGGGCSEVQAAAGACHEQRPMRRLQDVALHHVGANGAAGEAGAAEFQEFAALSLCGISLAAERRENGRRTQLGKPRGGCAVRLEGKRSGPRVSLRVRVTTGRGGLRLTVTACSIEWGRAVGARGGGNAAERTRAHYVSWGSFTAREPLHGAPCRPCTPHKWCRAGVTPS